MTGPAAAAVAAARRIGVHAGDPVVVRDLTNVLVHLRPAPVVARVSVTLASRGPAALETELAFASAAAQRGAPVVPPAHDAVLREDGFDVTFWRYVRHRRAEAADAAAIGRSLRALHDAVADLDLPLVRFDRLDEAESVAAALDHPDAPLMLGAIAAARKRVRGLAFDDRPLHGDSHVGNVLITREGPVWSDLENVCRGPAEYDLACLAWRERVHGTPGGSVALAAYGPYDGALVEELMPVLAAFLVPWNTLIARRGQDGDDRFLRERIEYLRTFA